MKIATSVLILLCFSAANAATSCDGRCGENDGDPTSCQCNEECETYGDCCSDYTEICYSCDGRCGEAYSDAKPCQCNVDCPSYGNCCDDFDSLCSYVFTDFTEVLFTLDVNRKTLVYDPNPPGPLFTDKDPSVDLSGPTIDPFIELRATYFEDTCATESEDVTLRDNFLDAIFATEVMTTTEDFMNAYNLLPSQYSGSLRACVEDIWFTFFDRCGSSSVDGSNGYEHSLIGEIDNGEVSGYHNWISWYIDEMEGEIEYLTLLGHEVIASDLSIIMVEMEWQGAPKPITSMWIGSSPEFEIAMYTVCFYMYPNALCPVTSNGHAYEIQTYDFGGDSTLVGSAYPNI